MKTLPGIILTVLLVLGLCGAASAQSRINDLNKPRGSSLWPSVSFSGGPLWAPPVGTMVVGPVGYTWGVDAFLNIGHSVALGLRYQATHLGRDNSVFEHMDTNEIVALADIPMINRSLVRWSALLGLGVMLGELREDRYRFEQDGTPKDYKDVNGDGYLEIIPAGFSLQKDTGAAFVLGTGLTIYPVDMVGIKASIQADYRFAPNLKVEQGALTLMGLFGVEVVF